MAAVQLILLSLWAATAALLPNPSSRVAAATAPTKVAFPRPTTPPSDVMAAQLNALAEGDIPTTLSLFSRARRLTLFEGARMDMRQRSVNPDKIHSLLAEVLSRDGPGLVGHRGSEILASLRDPEPPSGRLPTCIYRVKVDSASGGRLTFIFTLTRQSDANGSAFERPDGFERCWFVWSNKLDSDGGGGSDVSADAPTSPSTLVPA